MLPRNKLSAPVHRVGGQVGQVVGLSLAASQLRVQLFDASQEHLMQSFAVMEYDPLGKSIEEASNELFLTEELQALRGTSRG